MRLAGLVLLLTLAIPVVALANPPQGVELAVECGYDGYIQKGRVNPITVTMRNAAPNLNISGELVLDFEGVEYTAPLELPSPSEKRFFLYFPCPDYSPQLTLRIRSKQYTEEFNLFEPTAFKSMEADDVSIVVLSRQQGALNMLNQKSIARLYRNTYKSTASELSSGRVFASYYGPEQVDPSAKFFARADVIVLADFDYQQVSPELAEALRQAVSGGVSLVFSMGLSGAGIAGSPLADLCPLRYAGTSQVRDLGQFGRRYGIATKGAPAVFARGRVAADAEVLDTAGQLPAVVQAQRGSGTVTALAFDVTAAPFKRNGKLANVFLENALEIDDTASISSSFMHPYPVQLLLGKLSEAKPMTPGFVLLYLLAYILLIGPLNFLILDRFKRRTLVWTTIPLLIVAFSWLGMQTGYIRRGANNIAAYVQELHVYPGAAYAPYQTVALLFTARRADYTLEIEDPGAYFLASIPEPEAYFGMNRQPPLTVANRGKLQTEGRPLLRASQGQWDSRSYAYSGNLPLGGNTVSNLSATPTKNGLTNLQGTFTLDLPVDLRGCRLYAPQLNKDLGDLKGQGTYNVGQSTTPVAQVNSDNYLWQTAQLEDLHQLLKDSATFNLFYRDEVLLIGFTDQLDTLAKLSARGKSYKLGVVVVHLPYRAVLDSGGTPEVRTLLTGGSAFELRDEYGLGNLNYGRPSEYTTNPSAPRRYALQQNSYIDITCTVSGNLGSENELLMHLRGWTDKNEAISDLRNFVQVQHLSGNRWTPVRMTEPAQVDIPLNGTRRRQVRILATSECVIELPDTDVH